MIHAAPVELTFASAEARERVMAFCADHQITREFGAAVELASEVYEQVKHVTARIQTDPETDESRVVIDVALGGDAEDVLRRKKDFTSRWVQSAPPDVRERIRVLYHFA